MRNKVPSLRARSASVTSLAVASNHLRSMLRFDFILEFFVEGLMQQRLLLLPQRSLLLPVEARQALGFGLEGSKFLNQRVLVFETRWDRDHEVGEIVATERPVVVNCSV